MGKKPSELAAVVACIDPDAYTAAAYTSDYVDMQDFQQVMAVLQVGTMATNSTVDFKLVQATDSSGTGVKDISGKAATQLTEAGSDSDKQVILQARGDELDVAGGFRYVAAIMTVATAASDAGAVLLGFGPQHGPASDYDLASVDEIV